MPRPKGSYKIPGYRLHRSTGRAVVTVAGRDHYLGKHGTRQTSPESWRAYDRLIAEYLHRGRQGPEASDPATATIEQLIVAYLAHETAKRPGRGPHPSKRIAMRWLREHYGDTLARDFSPAALEALRAKMIRAHVKGRANLPTLARGFVNEMVTQIVRMFRWGMKARTVPAALWMELDAVEQLERGDFGVRETTRVLPVDEEHLHAVLELASPGIAAMIRTQLLTGMRPGELLSMRGRDLDTSGALWRYAPDQHKTKHLGKDRLILIGPKAQEIIRPFLKTDLSATLFSPRDAWERNPQLGGRGKKVPAHFNDRYVAGSYFKAIQTLCVAADRLAHARRPDVPRSQRLVPNWHPHQLRHNAATYMRAEGIPLDVIATVLGHSSRDMAEWYAQPDRAAAERAIAKLG